MNCEEVIKNFPVTVYGTFEKYSDVISKGRCRIFYKGCNRNGTFITEEFANKLLATIPYTPVKGIFDTEENDFTDHGEERTEGRIYGIVPAEPNLQWESCLDEDGVSREYACVDVLLYTGLYSEANLIPGKSQSMELYSKSIKGDWQIIDGRRYYVFTDACFLGLQALGDTTEPCFEGAAFYSLYQSLKDMVYKLENANIFQNKEQGDSKMSILNFKMSDNQKFTALWMLLNANYNEENNWLVEYDICEIYDEYAVVNNHNEGIYERIYYIKDDASDSLSISKRKRCYIVDVDEDEKKALDVLHQINGTYAQLDEKFTEIETLKEEISTHSTKVEELNNTIATLNVERDEANTQIATLTEKVANAETEYTTAKAAIESLTAEKDALVAYKKAIEDENKREIIASYSDTLSEEILEAYSANMDNYSMEELDMKLAYELKKSHPEAFSKNPQPARIPKEGTPKGGIEDILAKYEKH